MERDPGVLLVAATEPELGGRPGLVCGVGPVEAAAAVAAALAVDPPAAVLHVGLAGGAELEVTTLVVGTEAVYLDLEAAIPVVERVVPAPALVAAARAALPSSAALPIGTSAAVGWHRGADPRAPRVEAMEGFAADDLFVPQVNIALGSAPVDVCHACDTNGDGSVSVNELIAAVRRALDGC